MAPNEATQEEFERLEKAIGMIRKGLPLDKKIKLYGLWCVATRGKCTNPAPSRFNLLAYAKHSAWKSHDHLSKEEAQKKFVEVAKPLVPASKL